MSTGISGPSRGNNTDPVLAAYQATPEEQQEAFRNPFAPGLYTDAQIAAALMYLTGVTLSAGQVALFRQRLASGRVSW